MKDALLLLIGILATRRVTLDVASNMDLEGPFGIYIYMREFFRRDSNPVWMKEGVDCPFCVSFTIGHIIAAALPLDMYKDLGSVRKAFLYCAVSWAISGAVIHYIRKAQLTFGVSGDMA